MAKEPIMKTKKGEPGPWDFASYDDVPEEWQRYWQDECGLKPGEFPKGIDDSDFFARFRYEEGEEE